MKILCVDSGKMTGVSIIEWIDENVRVLVSTEVDDWNEAGRLIEGLISQKLVDVIVLEDFVITKAVKGQWTILLNGVIRHAAWKANIEVVGQNSQRAKIFATNKMLKALGLWHVGGEGHANDSLRHGLMYMVRNGFKDPRMLA